MNRARLTAICGALSIVGLVTTAVAVNVRSDSEDVHADGDSDTPPSAPDGVSPTRTRGDAPESKTLPVKPGGSVADGASRATASAPSASAAQLQQVDPNVRPAAASAPTEDQVRMEQVWASETENSEWTEATEDYLEDALSDAKIPVDRLRSVDCRDTLCRVKLHFTSQQEALGLYNLRQPDYTLRAFRSGEDYAVFIAREGKELPVPGPALPGNDTALVRSDDNARPGTDVVPATDPAGAVPQAVEPLVPDHPTE